MTAAETTWERHAAGLPARDREERARYVELDAPRRYVTEVSVPRLGDGGIQRLHSKMPDPEPPAAADASAHEPEPEMEAAS